MQPVDGAMLLQGTAPKVKRANGTKKKGKGRRKRTDADLNASGHQEGSTLVVESRAALLATSNSAVEGISRSRPDSKIPRVSPSRGQTL